MIEVQGLDVVEAKEAKKLNESEANSHTVEDNGDSLQTRQESSMFQQYTSQIIPEIYTIRISKIMGCLSSYSSRYPGVYTRIDKCTANIRQVTHFPTMADNINQSLTVRETFLMASTKTA